jgi:adenylate kinase family enzyme
MLLNVIAVIGPPAVGKTALAMRIGQLPGTRVFRLREHVPQNSLANTVTSAERLSWIDDITVITSARGYLETLILEGEIHTLLLDNFPGTGTQVGLFFSMLRQRAPGCIVRAIELVADPDVLRRRASSRRVCHHCERDRWVIRACLRWQARLIRNVVRAASICCIPAEVISRPSMRYVTSAITRWSEASGAPYRTRVLPSHGLTAISPLMLPV